MKQNLSLRLRCLLVLLTLVCAAQAQFFSPFSSKANTTQVVRESELYDLDKQLGVNGTYIFIYDKQQCDTVDGELHGKFRAFDSLDNSLVMEGEYSKGIRVGNWVWYDHGKKIVEGNYVDGRLDGLVIFYDKKLDGKVMVNSTLKDGKLDGVITKFSLKNNGLVRGFYLKEYYEEGLCNRVELFNEENARCLCGEYVSADTLYYVEKTTELLVNAKLCERTVSYRYLRPEGTNFADLEALVASMGTKDPKGMRGALNGAYSKVDSVAADTSLVLVKAESGFYKNNLAEGEWLTQYFTEGVNMMKRYEEGVQMAVEYTRMKNGKPYSGKLTVVESDAISVISIKKGQRNGKTIVTDEVGNVVVVVCKNGVPVEKAKK